MFYAEKFHMTSQVFMTYMYQSNQQYFAAFNVLKLLDHFLSPNRDFFVLHYNINNCIVFE